MPATVKLALGLDFGTESVRALLVDVNHGREISTAVVKYNHGVITDRYDNMTLGPDWALQHPSDWLNAASAATRTAMREALMPTAKVIGIGVDFTSCTMLPCKADGLPLCLISPLDKHPHAWPKLWKHHGAQEEADLINEVARKRGERWLQRYGGVVSSEWFFPKALEILKKGPGIYRNADILVEAGDWVVWQLTGKLVRSTCQAGYKAFWDKQDGFPPRNFFAAVDPKFADVISTHMGGSFQAPGTRAGTMVGAMARRFGLEPGTPVATAIIDAHAGVPGAAVTGAETMVMVMGTSTCHMVMSKQQKMIAGISGVVADGILPGYFGYEAGQAAVGDIFAWFIRRALSDETTREARAAEMDLHQFLAGRAKELPPGSGGVLALDWFNGCRTPLVNSNLSGLLVGLTLNTRPEQIYRALLESTACGTLAVIDTFVNGGLTIKKLVASGGLPEKNPFLMQIFADVTGRPIYLPASEQPCAFGSAILGAMAAGKKGGGYNTAGRAAAAMARLKPTYYRPNKQAHAAYQTVYQQYKKLSAHFGQGNDVMAALKHMQIDGAVTKETRKKKKKTTRSKKKSSPPR